MFSCGSWSSARRRSSARLSSFAAGPSGHRAPQVVEHLLVVLAPLALALLLHAQVGRAAARVAVHGVAHQRVRGVQQALDRRLAVAFLAALDEALGEFQVVEDAVGVGPLLEQIVVLEEVVVAERGVRDHQRLHRRRVLLHDVGDARVGVDDDLVGEALHAGAVQRLVAGEMLAERPVLVEQRHADRGIGVQHLLGADHLDLVRIDVQAQLVEGDLSRSRRARAGCRELPLGAFEQRPFDSAVHAHSARLPRPAPLAPEQFAEHRVDVAAVADLAHRHRRARRQMPE